MLRLRLWLKIRCIAISMVSSNEILIEKLVRSYVTRFFPQRFVILIWEINEKVSLHE